jgi:hypothetical protein
MTIQRKAHFSECPLAIPMLGFLALFSVLGAVIPTTAYDARRSADPSPSSCTLTPEQCTFGNAVGGTRYRLKFGSTCELNLTGCTVGRCSSVIDWSYHRRWGYAKEVRRSAFSSFNITNVASLNVSSGGVYFKPSGGDVTIRFAVQT